jgi:hypothetical protein
MATTNEKIILELTISDKEAKKIIADNAKEIKKLQDENKKLSKSYEENAEAITENEQKIKSMQRENAAYGVIVQKNTEFMHSQTGSIEEQKSALILLTAEYTKLSKEERENSEKGQKLAAQIREVSADLQDQQKALKAARQEEELREGSLAQMRKELSKLTAEYVKLSKEERENTDVGKNMQKQIRAISDELKRQEEKIGDFRRNVGDYKNAFKEAGAELLRSGGNFSSFSDTAAGIASAFPGYGQAIGGAIQLIGAPVEALITDFVKLKGEIQNLTGLTGPALDDLAARVDAVAKTFDDVEVEDLTNAANTLAKQMNVSFDEALTNIEKGFLAGANQSGEFLDQIKEYAPQFKDAGLSANEFIATISQNVKDGIFSDKGADVIKEAGLRLRENTKATSDALKVLGEDANKQIKEAIANGDTFKAIQLVSKGLNEVSLTASETQTIIADVFGGPGEDAGLQYLRSLQNINLELDKQIDLDNELVKRQQETLRINKEFSQALSELTGQFDGAGESMGNFAKQAGTYVVKFIAAWVMGAKILGEVLGGIKDATLAALKLDNEGVTKGLERAKNAYINVLAQQVKAREAADAKEQSRIRTQAEEQAAFLEKQRKAETEKLKAEQAARNKELYAKALEDQKALIERRLLEVEKGSEQEMKLRVELLRKQRDIELNNAELTANQRKLIAAKTELEIFEIRKAFFLKGLELSPISREQITKAEQENLERLKQQDQFYSDLLLKETDWINRSIQQRIKKNEDEKALALKNKEEQEMIEQAKYDSLFTITDAIGGLGNLLAKNSAQAANFQKKVALVQLTIDTVKSISTTISSATAAAAAGGPAAPLLVAGYIASGIATVLGAISQAKSLLANAEDPAPPQFERATSRAAGGGDFLTSGPTMLLVGDNPGGVERVTVQPLSGKGITSVAPDSGLIRLAGGGTVTADGGLITRSAAAPVVAGQKLGSQVVDALKGANFSVSVREINNAQDNNDVTVGLSND